jgi:hypothetical protein
MIRAEPAKVHENLDLAPSNEFHYACRAASGVSPSTLPASFGGAIRAGTI